MTKRHDPSTDKAHEECKESKNGVPFLLLAEKRHDGEYPSCRSKKTKQKALWPDQAIDASLIAKKRRLVLVINP